MSDNKTPPPTPLPGNLVWEVPTRLFHWILVLLFVVAWLTAEDEQPLFLIHQLAGYGILVAVLFRLVWGFAGGRYARFSNFIRPWSRVRDYFRNIFHNRQAGSVGHNPAGGWMIVLLLTLLTATVVSGLFVSDDGIGGPWAVFISPNIAHMMEDVHEALAEALLIAVFVHIAGVVLESFLEGRNLVSAMWTGRKKELEDDQPENGVPVAVAAWRAPLILLFSTLAIWAAVSVQ